MRYEELEGIQEASRILNRARLDASNGSMCVWRKITHAQDYLNKQIVEALAPEPESCESVTVQ